MSEKQNKMIDLVDEEIREEYKETELDRINNSRKALGLPLLKKLPKWMLSDKKIRMWNRGREK